MAKAGDVAVWRTLVNPSQRDRNKDHGAVAHSAVLVKVAFGPDGRLDQEKTLIDHKPGERLAVERGVSLLEAQKRYGGGYSVYRKLGSKDSLRIDKRYPAGANEWPDRDLHDGLEEFIEKLFGKIPNDTPKCDFPVRNM